MNLLILLTVRISSYGCTWEVRRALKKLELLSAAPRPTLTHFSCSPNFPRASIIRYTHAKHEQILNYDMSEEKVTASSVRLKIVPKPKTKIRGFPTSRNLNKKHGNLVLFFFKRFQIKQSDFSVHTSCVCLYSFTPGLNT